MKLSYNSLTPKIKYENDFLRQWRRFAEKSDVLLKGFVDITQSGRFKARYGADQAACITKP